MRPDRKLILAAAVLAAAASAFATRPAIGVDETQTIYQQSALRR